MDKSIIEKMEGLLAASLEFEHAVRALLFPGGEHRGKDVTVDRMQAQHEHRTVKEMVS